MPLRAKEIPQLSEKDIARFWSKVDKSPGHGPDGNCWEWTASRYKGGYGYLGVGGKLYLAHRISYAISKEPPSPSLCVLHTCDNPACVNPDHLFQGTHTDNMHDMKRKGRGRCGPSGDSHHSRTRPECMPRGEQHWRAKLTVENVVEIRKRYAAGGCSCQKLAEEHGVSRGNIGCIIRRETWVDI